MSKYVAIVLKWEQMAIISKNFFLCYSSEGQLNTHLDYVNHKSEHTRIVLKIMNLKKGVGIDHCNKTLWKKQ